MRMRFRPKTEKKQDQCEILKSRDIRQLHNKRRVEVDCQNRDSLKEDVCACLACWAKPLTIVGRPYLSVSLSSSFSFFFPLSFSFFFTLSSFLFFVHLTHEHSITDRHFPQSTCTLETDGDHVVWTLIVAQGTESWNVVADCHSKLRAGRHTLSVLAGGCSSTQLQQQQQQTQEAPQAQQPASERPQFNARCFDNIETFVGGGKIGKERSRQPCSVSMVCSQK